MPVFNGTLGDDTINGGAGDDTLNGFAGDDFLRGLGGDDVLNGGDGFDFADYRDASGAVVVTLRNSAAGTSSGAAGSDRLFSIEGVRGSNFNDRLTGNSEDNFIRGMQGDDIINGGGGLDFADYRNAEAGVRVTLGDGATAGQSSGADGVDTLRNIEGIRGGDFVDRLTGNTDDNVIRGMQGNDILNGGGGFDFVDYRNAEGSVTVRLGTGATAGSSSGADGADRLTNFEGIGGSSFGDRLTGNSGDNALRGRYGNDVLNGGQGDDAFQFVAELNATENVDTIQAFRHADDTIGLSKEIFANVAGAPGDTLAPGQFALTTDAPGANDRIIYDAGTGELFYDPNGGSRANAVLFAVISNPATAGVAFDDFVLI